VQSPYVEVYKPYEREFVLVQWDQRGSGKTFGKLSAKTQELTPDRVVKDGIELAEYLNKKFNRKIIVSVIRGGMAIATHMVLQRPECLLPTPGPGRLPAGVSRCNTLFAENLSF
jgi:hypothetical protein